MSLPDDLARVMAPDFGKQPQRNALTPQTTAQEQAMHQGFKHELTALLNKYSLEGGSDTPDFLLADYLVQCLAVFDVTIAHREAWYGRPLTTRATAPREES